MFIILLLTVVNEHFVWSYTFDIFKVSPLKTLKTLGRQFNVFFKCYGRQDGRQNNVVCLLGPVSKPGSCPFLASFLSFDPAISVQNVTNLTLLENTGCKGC